MLLEVVMNDQSFRRRSGRGRWKLIRRESSRERVACCVVGGRVSC